MNRNMKLRPIRSQDLAFLYQVYASTRQAELDQLDWDDAQQETFLKQQFNAQHTYYQSQFPDADFDLILLEDEAVGRLYVDRREDEIRIVDIALLPRYHNQGIGSVFLQAILAEAEREGLPVRIHVEQFNPAMRLYQRLGFRKIGDNGIYSLMEWSPSQFPRA